MFDKYQYNPAYAGMDYGLSINAHTRNQWQGIDQSPSFVSINAHTPYYVWSGALGMRATSRGIGVLRESDVSFSYNYVLNTGYGLWSNGIRLGVRQLSVDGNAIVTPDGIYSGGSVIHNDPILLETIDRGVGLLWEVGSYFTSERLELGLTIGRLPGNDVREEKFIFNNKVDASLFAQYRFELLGEFDFLQSLLLKSNLNQVQTEIASIIRINGNVFGGLGVRGYSSTSIDAILIILGIDITKKLTLTYSYDAGLSGIRNVNEGSHELHINYNLGQLFGKGLPPKIIYNPRYL